MVVTRSTLKQLQQSIVTRSQQTNHTKLFSIQTTTPACSRKRPKYVHTQPTSQKHHITPEAPIEYHIVTPVTPLKPLTLQFPDEDDDQESLTVHADDSDYEPNYWFDIECQSVPTSPQYTIQTPPMSPMSEISTIPSPPSPEKTGLILKFKNPIKQPIPFLPFPVIDHPLPLIDFEEASEAWKSNKRKGANGTYVYTCGKSTKSGNPCKNPVHDTMGVYSGCKRHYMWEEKEHKYAF